MIILDKWIVIRKKHFDGKLKYNVLIIIKSLEMNQIGIK